MKRFRSWFYNVPEGTRWRAAILFILVVAAAIPSAVALRFSGDWQGLLLNFGTEMGGAFVTFILIDLIIARRDRMAAERQRTDELRDMLVHKLGSSVNTEARRAAEQLRQLGWLTDGSLEMIELVGANLEGVDLRGAVLRGARMYRANLKKAQLYKADFTGAIMTGADLTGAKLVKTALDGAILAGANLTDCRMSRKALACASRLKGATMPDGLRYDGRFCLDSDLKQAHKHSKKNKEDPTSPGVLAAWYGVSTEEFQKGQQWASTHLDAARRGEDNGEAGWGLLHGQSLEEEPAP